MTAGQVSRRPGQLVTTLSLCALSTPQTTLGDLGIDDPCRHWAENHRMCETGAIAAPLLREWRHSS